MTGIGVTKGKELAVDKRDIKPLRKIYKKGQRESQHGPRIRNNFIYWLI
jgi:hypothetical protein